MSCFMSYYDCDHILTYNVFTYSQSHNLVYSLSNFVKKESRMSMKFSLNNVMFRLDLVYIYMLIKTIKKCKMQ